MTDIILMNVQYMQTELSRLLRAKLQNAHPTYGQLFGDQIHSICIQGQQLWTKVRTGFQSIIQTVYKLIYMTIKLMQIIIMYVVIIYSDYHYCNISV